MQLVARSTDHEAGGAGRPEVKRSANIDSTQVQPSSCLCSISSSGTPEVAGLRRILFGIPDLRVSRASCLAGSSRGRDR
jgi:hypothetical protein